SCLIESGTLEAVNVIGGAAPYQYSIDGGLTFSSDPVFTGLDPGTYNLVIQDAMGEILESTEFIVPAPELAINLAAQASLLLGESTQLEVQLNLLPSQIDSIIWTPATGLSCTDCLNPIAMPTQTTEYTVTVIDIYGCEAEARVLVVVDPSPAIYIPNAFSPNGDGINDIFLIYARDGSVERIRKFQVFDRWGELVFEYENFDPNNPAYGWDGYFRGELMNPAVFAYYAIVDFINGQQMLYEGDITLVR
ncbi:MAG: gliding motility-associated C-terminal domain-containing protein, partial [Phaeodactylibacter sp.]|nr:gliding motility-associated C-terminal domain-containing protein [Phaeodactylibacter sp.]